MHSRSCTILPSFFWTSQLPTWMSKARRWREGSLRISGAKVSRSWRPMRRESCRGETALFHYLLFSLLRAGDSVTSSEKPTVFHEIRPSDFIDQAFAILVKDLTAELRNRT